MNTFLNRGTWEPLSCLERQILLVVCGFLPLNTIQIQWLKAQLGAKGYTQTYNVDYLKTFFPVVRFNLACIVISLRTNFGWSLHEVDVKNALLYDNFGKKVYMNKSHGFVARRG